MAKSNTALFRRPHIFHLTDKGTATIETSGKRYEETAAWIEDMGNKAGMPLKSKGAVIITIDDIFGLAPGPGAGKKLT